MSDWDFEYWNARAQKREGAVKAIYDREKDSFLPFEGDEFSAHDSPLPLTKKGLHRAMFLDRDGIINTDKSYVYKIEDVEFVPDIEKVIALANEHGLKVIVLTNQSGVGRGLYKEEDVLKLHQWMGEKLLEKGARVDGWYYSPYHPESEEGKYKRASITRKPNPGMALMAAEDWNIDLSRSFMIGDKVSDILAQLDLQTILIRGNYPLGGYEMVCEDHQELITFLKKYVLNT